MTSQAPNVVSVWVETSTQVACWRSYRVRDAQRGRSLSYWCVAPPISGVLALLIYTVLGDTILLPSIVCKETVTLNNIDSCCSGMRNQKLPKSIDSPRFSSPPRSSCHRRNEHQHSKHRLHLRSKHGTFQSLFSICRAQLKFVLRALPGSADAAVSFAANKEPHKEPPVTCRRILSIFPVPTHLQAGTQSASASANAAFLTRFPSTI